jgi:hypothetical protein
VVVAERQERPLEPAARSVRLAGDRPGVVSAVHRFEVRDAVLDLGLVAGAVHDRCGRGLGEVDEGSVDGRRRNAVSPRDLSRLEAPRSVDRDPLHLPVARGGHVGW